MVLSKLTDYDGNISNTTVSIANTFNNYFSKIASNLKSDIDSHGRNGDENYHQTFLKNSVSESMFLNRVDAHKVFGIINNFKNKSMCDTKISALKVANTSYGFTSTLALVINKSFQQGVFPEQLKLARVNPIHKEGSNPTLPTTDQYQFLLHFQKFMKN